MGKEWDAIVAWHPTLPCFFPAKDVDVGGSLIVLAMLFVVAHSVQAHIVLF